MKKRSQFLLLLFTVVIPTIAYSQDSIYLALSPQWNKTYWFGSKGENSVSLAKDKNDNVYMATYHRLWGERLDTALFVHKANYDESISAAVIKHDARGKILWVNSVVSQETRSEATSIALDSKGNVVVVGIIRGKGLFTSTDTTAEITLSLEKKEHSFVAKYNPAGKLLWVKTFLEGEPDQFSRNSISSISIDRKDNIYFCGTRFIPIKEKGSINFDASILIGKLDATGMLVWEQIVNSGARDAGVQGVLDSKGYFYAGAIFNKSILVGADSLKPFPKGENSFVVKVGPTGKVIWTLCPKPAGTVSLGALAIDKQDRLYMAGEFWDTLRVANYPGYLISKARKNLFVACFTGKGQLSWMKRSTEEWHPSSYNRIKQLRVGDDGFLYLSGSALGMSVRTLNVELNSGLNEFKYTTGEKFMGSEGFIIQYDLSGNTRWMRIVSGKGEQIISDFVVNKNSDLSITGNFSHHLDFKNSSVETLATVFYTHVPASTLRDTGPDKIMLARQQEEQRRTSILMTDCSCEEYAEKQAGYRAFTPVSSLLSEDYDKALLNAIIADTAFSHLFAYNLQGHNGYYNFNVSAFKPIRIKLTQKVNDDPSAITLDLTPCEMKQEKFLSVRASFHGTYPLDEIQYDEEFNGSGIEYFNLMLAHYELGIEGVLGNFTFSFEDEYTEEELEPFIAYLNKKFKLTIKSSRESNLTTQLEATGKEIDLAGEVYNFFLKPLEGPDKKPTKAFDDRMQKLFQPHEGQGIDYRSAEWFKMNYVDPRYQGSADVKRFKIDFPPSLINSESPWAMFRVRELEWSSQTGLLVDYRYLDQFCMRPFSIGATGVGISITGKIFPDISSRVNTLTDHHDYEIPVVPYGFYERLHTIAPSFTGVYAKEFDITIPVNNQRAILKGFDLLISGQEITGWLQVRGNNNFTMDELLKRLRELQFKDVTVKVRKYTSDGVIEYIDAAKDVAKKQMTEGEDGLVFFRFRNSSY